MKINIPAIRILLSPEQRDKFDDMLMRNQDAVESLKILKKDFSNIKNNIKRIEKKRLKMIEELPADDKSHYSNWISREIDSIEKKYVGIEKGIRNCKLSEQEFTRTFKSFQSGWHNNFDYYLQNLNRSSASYSGSVAASYDCIRITKRYFKNITSAFAYYEKQKQWTKANELRKAKLQQENPQ